MRRGEDAATNRAKNLLRGSQYHVGQKSPTDWLKQETKANIQLIRHETLPMSRSDRSMD